MTVWVKSTIIGRSPSRSVFALIAYGRAYIGRLVCWPNEIVNGVEEFVRWLDSFPARDAYIKTLRVMGHGQRLKAGSCCILVGQIEDIRSDDFDDDGNLFDMLHAQQTKKLLDALKAALCPNGRLMFSACWQGTGGLLENVSRYIDKGITVEGWSGTGYPWLRGNMT